MHLWTFNQNLVDVVASFGAGPNASSLALDTTRAVSLVQLVSPTHVRFAPDRFGNDASSLLINSGFLALPPASTYFAAAGSFTLAVWLNANAGGGSDMRLLDCSSSRTISSFVVGVQDARPFAITTAVVGSSGRTTRLSASNTSLLRANVWTHLAYTYDALAARQTMYMDGLVAAESAAGVPVAATVGTGPCWLGRGQALTVGAASFASLLIDDLMLFSTALAAEQLALVAGVYLANEYAAGVAPSIAYAQSFDGDTTNSNDTVIGRKRVFCFLYM